VIIENIIENFEMTKKK
jgi:hypothetical protein